MTRFIPALVVHMVNATVQAPRRNLFAEKAAAFLFGAAIAAGLILWMVWGLK